MKLKMTFFDFSECEIGFRIPEDIMRTCSFGAVTDGVEVDLGAITGVADQGIKESPSTDVQQLKAEIAALATEIESCLGHIPSGDNVFSLIAKMQQLSAV